MYHNSFEHYYLIITASIDPLDLLLVCYCKTLDLQIYRCPALGKVHWVTSCIVYEVSFTSNLYTDITAKPTSMLGNRSGHTHWELRALLLVEQWCGFFYIPTVQCSVV